MKMFVAALILTLCGHAMAVTKPFINHAFVEKMGREAIVLKISQCIYRHERLVCIFTNYLNRPYIAFGIPEDGFFRIRYLVEIINIDTGEAVEVYRHNDKEV
jgi:hypothetical protein